MSITIIKQDIESAVQASHAITSQVLHPTCSFNNDLARSCLRLKELFVSAMSVHLGSLLFDTFLWENGHCINRNTCWYWYI